MPKFEKGNAVIGQSGGPTCAINATLAGVIKGCLDSENIDKIYGMKNGIEGLINEDFYNIREYFSDSEHPDLPLLCATPASALGSCRKKINDIETIEAIYNVLEKYDIRFFFYIGGNDSMDAVMKLSNYKKEHPCAFDVNFIGVPKTIDNDLVLTDHTPGFGSAAKYIAASMQEIMRDVAVYTTKAVTIVEIMGRDAGWLTASSCLSKAITGVGPDLIYLPERAFSRVEFIEEITSLLSKQNFVVVAVSEGIKDDVGNYVADDAMSGAVDTFGHKYLAGTGKYLENLIREKIGCKVRSVELNILQRCASHIASETDITESVETGISAVNFAVAGETGVMVCTNRKTENGNYSLAYSAADVCLIANKIKTVPDDFINTSGNGVTGKCVKYLLPLIFGECQFPYNNGLPLHFKF